MPEELKGKRPEQIGGTAEKEAAAGGEVGGRAKLLYTCWNCSAGNYVEASWSWFTCWSCGALNYM
ncbi:MAG: hypothetical protein JO331_14420 [Verrucomicrobia bacterium]|nr:hypothetical protein [Verrucomicrobiota bacterium]MBV8970234.1 hypothetical protein [Verrucomicrobiota bacterium]